MPPETFYKTVYQYNKVPIPGADMARLLEVAEGCRQVKNCVYDRYSGIHSLSKITPGYAVQNEMTASGVRERIGLPAGYFYIAIFDALGDTRAAGL